MLLSIHAVNTSEPAWQLRVVTRWTQKHVGKHMPKESVAMLENLLLSILKVRMIVGLRLVCGVKGLDVAQSQGPS